MWLQHVVLGIIQGLTEFLPISSSAHLILVPVFTGWPDQGVGFDLAVHIGTLLAVILYFRCDVVQLIADGIRSIWYQRSVGQSRLAWAIVLGTIPAGLAGLPLIDLIDTMLRSVQVIFFTTLGFALLLGLADRRKGEGRSLPSLTWRDVFLIGCAQALSLIPGTSRSGVTITAGLFLGLNREAAARFSFLLAIPITGLAGTVKLVQMVELGVAVDWIGFLVGGGTAFITAVTALHFFLKWLNRWGMWPYVVYRIGLALVIYLVLLK